jgi:hypothetical protein
MPEVQSKCNSLSEVQRLPTHCFFCNEVLGVGISLKWDAWKQFLNQAPEAEIVFRVKAGKETYEA